MNYYSSSFLNLYDGMIFDSLLCDVKNTYKYVMIFFYLFDSVIFHKFILVEDLNLNIL